MKHMPNILYVTVLAAVVLVLAASHTAAQTAYTYSSEGYEQSGIWPTSASSTEASITSSTGTWRILKAFQKTAVGHTGSFALALNSTGYFITPQLVNGAGTLTYFSRSTSTTARTVTVQKSTDGTNFTTITTINTGGSTYIANTLTINDATVRYIKLVEPSSGGAYFDDFSVTAAAGGSPSLSVTPTSRAFGNVVINTISAEQTYALAGSSLTPASDNITVTAPTGFQVSATTGTGFASSITVAYSGGALASRNIFVRFTPTAIQAYSGNITNAGGGATTQNVAVTGAGVSASSPTISVTPTSRAFGSVTVNTTSPEMTYSVSGSALTPASGNITITAPGNFQVSTTTGSGFASSITVAYTGGALAARTIFVHFTPTAVQNYSGNITNAGGGATTQNVAVTGAGVSAPPPGTFYVATNGSDSNPGTQASPFATITKAVSVATAGNVIFVRGGTYNLSTTIAISTSGTSGHLISLLAFPGEKPLLDFSAMSVSSSNRGIVLSGSFWHIMGINIRKAGDNGMFVSGSNDIIEFCAFSENSDTGLQLGGGASNDQIINCDSFFNADPSNGNADGFAAKLDIGTNISFVGCRSWQNSDDGWDGYLRPSDDVSWSMDNCWCFMNGFLKDGSASSGNGNGFKLGGSDNADLRHNVTVTRCLSFYNRVKGYDQNHDKGSITILNSTAFSNGTNFNITEALASGKTLTVENCISAGTGAVNLGSFAVLATNSWMSPFVVTNADFVSMDSTGVRGPRGADGSLPTLNFMHLASGSDLVNAGTNVGLPFNGSKPDLGCFESSFAKAAEAPSQSITQAPTEYQMNQNYPNPFNPTTNIKYQLPEAGIVRLAIFDVLGREVGVLVNEQEAAGTYSVSFDATKLSSGIYFARLQAGTFVQMRKLVLQK